MNRKCTKDRHASVDGMLKTYSGEIVFRVESKIFVKAKSLKASKDKFPCMDAVSFSGYLKQFVELHGKIHSMFYCRFTLLCLCNGPFAAGGHMVQNPPCWRASYALGHPKQRKCKFVLMKSLCSGCPSGQLALQHGGFCTM